MFLIEQNFDHDCGLHWSLIVICHPNKMLNINDEFLNLSYQVTYFKHSFLKEYFMIHISDKKPKKTLRTPCILHPNSVKGYHNNLKDLVRMYFKILNHTLLSHVSTFFSLPRQKSVIAYKILFICETTF